MIKYKHVILIMVMFDTYALGGEFDRFINLPCWQLKRMADERETEIDSSWSKLPPSTYD